ncbi:MULTISPECIES: fasciclin domain-containing protein [Sphingobacterium]|uniref:FAS1 domain-containing protein n=1 Tax=Sphingobacterium cellulitidis TaxID=1768011 RepID=A0A8H9G1W5_9SPHI|nr:MULTISPECIES: fasciclin domain-containing protein [Sphingobacterium]MBA8988227.1 putative surface protein with fasciclin (FAS1) repeats [Sphingobacterium soli]OYD43129.1 hypothetical protein CHT99_04735 [Sphingobacterium cellulitidis]OYD47532.1 hypothetical protein CHU00_01255 [Sphingobacterium cellulitidis]WFB62517.1 fasciclin domain-containing protein [Sphingobacterium sp. WM]GGE30297.1 hypothetical protein GCM10011516_30160 [Sphingobacterium soli]
MKRLFKPQYIALFFFGILFLSACSKDDYYEDGGLAKAEFDGSIIQYLETKPVLFDTIVEIIKLAGLEKDFQEKEFTFFAPADPDIKGLVRNQLNPTLFSNGLDTIKTLADVDGEIWRKYLLRHMFNGKNKLADYPQIDVDLLSTYPGQNYISLEGSVCNIGVVFNDIVQMNGSTVVSRLKYKGYRQLQLSYIQNESNPTAFLSYPVSTSDIQPKNGVIHVLDYTKAYFGLDILSMDFISDVVQSKR